MDVALTLTFATMGLVVLAPAFTFGRALARRADGDRSRSAPALALLWPLLAGYVAVAVLWLVQYDGRCGGWLGETRPCEGFAEFARNTLFMAAMTLAMPGLLGILAGLAAMASRRNRRGPSPPSA
jgi:hypothetical protein